MKYLQEKFSVGDYHPNPEKCCEGCVFGGEHREWCPVANEEFRRSYLDESL